MIATLAVLALTLAAVPPEASQIRYEVRIINTPAAEWRSEVYRHCDRVGGAGRPTAWTIDEAKVGDLIRCVQGRTESNLVMAPVATAEAGSVATVSTTHARSFVVDLARVSDGPSTAFRPTVEQIMEGATFRLTGQKSATGVTAHVSIESHWVANVATVEVREPGRTSPGILLELPQVVDATVEADCEIPAGRRLLVSLGSATTVDARKRPVVMERLALISAKPAAPAASVERARSVEIRVDAALQRTSAEMVMPQSLPPLPSRSLPITADGVPMPTVADVNVSQAGLTGPPVPRPSPQMQITSTPGVDPAVKATGFDSAKATVDGGQLATGRAQKLRIPLGGPLSIEMEVRVVPGAARD